MDEPLLALFCLLVVLLCQDEEEGVFAYQVSAGFAVCDTMFVVRSQDEEDFGPWSHDVKLNFFVFSRLKLEKTMK